MDESPANHTRQGIYVIPLVLATAAFLSWFGLGPAVGNSLTDLGIATFPYLFIQISMALISAVLAICAYWIGRATHREPSVARRRFLSLLVITFCLSLTGLGIVKVDSDDLDSWRFAHRLDMFNRDIVQHARSGGVHRISAQRNDGADYNQPLASLHLPYELSLFGGSLQLIARVEEPCDGSAIRASFGETGSSIGDTILLAEGHCEQPAGVIIDIPAGQQLLSFYVDVKTTDSAKIQLEAIAKSVGFSPAYTVLSLFAFSVTLACFLFVLFPSRHQHRIRHRLSKAAAIQIVIVAVAFIVLSSAGALSFVSGERTIYTWDFGGHWMTAVNVVRALEHDTEVSSEAGGGTEAGPEKIEPDERLAKEDPGPLSSLLRSIRYSDYNPVTAIPLAAPMLISGPTRASYILSLVNVYVLSTLFILTGLLWTVQSRTLTTIPTYWAVIPALVILFFNPLWVPILRGYLGIGVVAVNVLVLWLYFNRPLPRHSLMSIGLISLLLATSVLMRRWNAYWVVGFFAIVAIDCIWWILRNKSFSLKEILSVVRMPAAVGVGAVLVLATIAWPAVVKMLTTDYADIYSAYAELSEGYTGHLRHIVRAHGLLLLMIVGISITTLLLLSTLRRMTTLLTIQLVFVYVYFSSTQTMGPHHLYTLMPGILIILGAAMVQLIGHKSNRVRLAGALLTIVYVINGAASHVAVFVPGADAFAGSLVPLVPDNRRIPLVRNDIDSFGQLASYLDDKTKSMGKDTSIYVLASSTVFSEAHLRMLEVSTGTPFESVGNIARTNAIDKRDGFPRSLLLADLVLVAEPVQLHRRPEDQQIVHIPAAQLRSGAGIGKAFAMLPTSFNLDGDVTILVYERMRPVATDELEELSNALRLSYPDRPEIYDYQGG